MIPRILLFNQKVRVVFHSTSIRPLTKSSQAPRPEGKHYRLWSMPGDLVKRKEILAKQYTMLWHPGLNAGIDENRTIYALCDGVMVVTEEEFKPDWTHPLVSKVYVKKEGEKEAPLCKRYINVIPKKRLSQFKLIDMV